MSDYLTQNARNDQPLQDLHTLLQSSSSNGGYFYGGSQKYYYYAAAMDNLRSDRQWFALTIVPDQVLSSRSAPILFQVRLLILLIIVIAGVGTLLCAQYPDTAQAVISSGLCGSSDKW